MLQRNFLESKSKNAETQEEKFARDESALGLSGRYYWMKGWEVAQKFYRVKKNSLCQGSCLVVFICKISRNLLARHETARLRLKALRLHWNLSLVKIIFSRVCESYFPSTCWPNRIAVKYFLLLTHKSVGRDEAQWELDDVLNSDLLFASWQTVFSRLVTLAALPGFGSQSYPNEPGNGLVSPLLHEMRSYYSFVCSEVILCRDFSISGYWPTSGAG